MAESAAAKSMEQMEELKRILMQFNQTGGVQVINMVQDSLKIMDAQHQVLFQELQDVRAQLSAMQESMTKQNQKDLPLAKKIVTGLESRISEIGNYVSGVKRGIGEKVSNVLKDFKAHGIIALNNIADKLGVKDLFKSVEKFFNKKVGEIQKSLDTLNTISHEVNEVKTHKQNIYRALKGKELIEVPEKQGKVFALLSNLLNKCLQVCVNCSSKAHDLAVKLEKLEVKALDAGDSLKKNSELSVSGKLNRFKQEIAVKDDKQNEEPNRENMTNVPQLEDKQKKHEERSER